MTKRWDDHQKHLATYSKNIVLPNKSFSGGSDFMKEIQRQVTQGQANCYKRLDEIAFPATYSFTEKLNSSWVETQTAKIVCLNLMECIYHD